MILYNPQNMTIKRCYILCECEDVLIITGFCLSFLNEEMSTRSIIELIICFIFASGDIESKHIQLDDSILVII